ncbi:MAG: Spy/CpxP family protein refolding chaperone, partial [Nitrospirales bacterium]|nr:Spy/CpxP family protein refolding chaperone [Nitrospirales bacterium]
SHKDMGSKGHGYSPHGKYSKGHGYGHSSSRHGYGGHMGPHQSANQFIQHILKFKQAMAITDAQEDQLKSINTNYKKTKIKMKAEVDLANLDLHELLRNDQAPLSDIESKLKNVHILKADLLMASIKAKREAKAVLTDEQRQRMKAVHERIKQYGSGSMYKGHPGGYKHHGKSEEKES